MDVEPSSPRGAYEPPRVVTLGSLYDLTQTICILNKTLGSPDYWSRIPIANCSS
jgi:hypothetical protein